MSEPQRMLFVYGSLLSGANHPLGGYLRQHAVFSGTGTIQARLYIIPDPSDTTNAYPGAVPCADASQRVHGELYALNDQPGQVMATLDEFEHCSPGRAEPYEFLRRNVLVRTDLGTHCRAMTYLYTWDVAGALHVPAGRFTEDASQVR